MRRAVKFSDTDSARIFDDAGDQAMNLMTYKARSLDEAQRNLRMPRIPLRFIQATAIIHLSGDPVGYRERGNWWSPERILLRLIR
jgi:hypothetical protein